MKPLACCAVLIVGLMSAACRPVPPAPTPEPTLLLESIRAILDYINSSDADVLTAAEAIFLGQVTAVSPTHFNQDSGEYYTETPCAIG